MGDLFSMFFPSSAICARLDLPAVTLAMKLALSLTGSHVRPVLVHTGSDVKLAETSPIAYKFDVKPFSRLVT